MIPTLSKRWFYSGISLGLCFGLLACAIGEEILDCPYFVKEMSLQSELYKQSDGTWMYSKRTGPHQITSSLGNTPREAIRNWRN